MNEIVDIKNLTVSFATDSGEVQGVNDVSLQIFPDEILAIVGESGSGKTVTARSIIELLPDSATKSGVVTLSSRDGVVAADVFKLSDADLRKVRGKAAAMVFQEPTSVLNPVYRVGWQIAEGLRAHGKYSKAELKAKVLDIMQQVGIPEPEVRYNYYPHQFSGGQKQRIVIAMALVLEPQLIIADEPTTALDVTIQAEILDLLRVIRDKFHKSVLLITHNMGVVADLADRVIVMHDAKIVETGSVEDIFYQPKQAYTKKLLAAIPRIDTKYERRKVYGEQQEPVVQVQDLKVTFPGTFTRPAFKAVRNINFTISKGEVLGLVGESGSGKTTTGRALVGLTPLSWGMIDILGIKLHKGNQTHLYKTIREKIGFVFQDPASSFNPLLTIGQSIAEPLLTFNRYPNFAAARPKVEQLLADVQLPVEYAKRFPHELSGGQRQRAGFARGLALDPELVIADEPTSALDVTVQATVLDLFRDLQREHHFACLFITHDLAVINQIADRVLVMKDGEIVESGPVDQILQNPQQPYTQKLIASIPLPDPRAQRAKTHRDFS